MAIIHIFHHVPYDPCVGGPFPYSTAHFAFGMVLRTLESQNTFVHVAPPCLPPCHPGPAEAANLIVNSNLTPGHRALTLLDLWWMEFSLAVAIRISARMLAMSCAGLGLCLCRCVRLRFRWYACFVSFVLFGLFCRTVGVSSLSACELVHVSCATEGHRPKTRHPT